MSATASARPWGSARARPAAPLRLGVLVLTTWAAVEIAAAAVLAWTAEPRLDVLLGEEQRRQIRTFLEHQDVWYQRHDPVLGWTNAPRGSFLHFTSSEQGLRGTRVYAAEPAPGMLRVAAFGDSFVHGDEVADRDVWTARIEASRPDVEVLNFGVSGYGTDQALLRFRRDGSRFHPHVVLVGFIADDLFRNANVFRPFLAPGTGHQMTKPRFRLEDGELRLVPNPLPRLEDYRRLLDDPLGTLAPLVSIDAFFPPELGAAAVGGPTPSVRLWHLVAASLAGRESVEAERRMRTDGEAFAVTVALFEAFRRDAERAGARFLVVLFPVEPDVAAARRGEAPSYEPLRAELAARRFDVVDALEWFAERARDVPPGELFLEVHYSPAGNRLVAEHVLDALAARGLLPDRIGRECPVPRISVTRSRRCIPAGGVALARDRRGLALRSRALPAGRLDASTFLTFAERDTRRARGAARRAG
jgi:hypothetical protein